MTRSATACRRCVSTRSPGARTAGRRWFEGPASAARVARNPPPAPPLQGGETLGRFAIRRAGPGARGISETHIDSFLHPLFLCLVFSPSPPLAHASFFLYVFAVLLIPSFCVFVFSFFFFLFFP